MKETIWKVNVSEDFLTFTEQERPSDFNQKATEHDYKEFGGTYCGDRGYGDVEFKLVRKLKAEHFYNSGYKDEWGNFSLMRWRQAFGYSYAWSPSTFYDYNGELYCGGCLFL